MADRTSTARVNPPPRRKVASQLPLSGSLPSSSPSTPLSTQPRLKAHINPANIIGGSPSPATAPSPRPVVRTPSNVSIRADAPVRSTPRSDVGGPSSARASPALVQKPLVARAGSGVRVTQTAPRSGASLPGSAIPSGASTPTNVHARRPASALGNNSSSPTPLSQSPQPDQGYLNPSAGSRFRAALAGAGTSGSEGLGNVRPAHVRSASFTPGPRSDSSNSQLSSNSRTAPRQGSGRSSPPRTPLPRSTAAGSAGVPRRRSDESSPRPCQTGAGTPPSSHSPSSSTEIPRSAVRHATEPRLSALAEVTTSSENLTQHLLPTASTLMGSSLLSPSTMIPGTLATPPTIDKIDLNGEGHELEVDPPSERSASVRPSPKPASPPTALHSHLAHLGLGALAIASAPTSPRSRNVRLGLERKRMPLLWNPTHGTPLTFPAPPDSPELRTVELPIMTPARSPETSEHLTLRPRDLSRRFSSGSENSQGETSAIGLRKSMSPRARVSPEAIMPWSESLLDSNPLEASSPVARWESTGDESGYGDFSDDHQTDDDIDLEAEIDENLLELTPSAEMELERDKWERKIADLEISNSSLMNINRMLETTKVKQQGEIVRLRRALRDARSGVPERPVLERTSSIEDDPDSSGSWGDDEMEDPELEKRWDQLRDLIGVMRKTGEDAVERLSQDVKPHQRVLGWLEVEAMGIGRSEDTTREHSEVDPAETVSGATETTDSYSNTGVTDTMSERSEAAPTEIGLVARVPRMG